MFNVHYKVMGSRGFQGRFYWHMAQITVCDSFCDQSVKPTLSGLIDVLQLYSGVYDVFYSKDGIPL